MPKKQNPVREAVQRIGLAMAMLPPEKREFMIGYAEGVIEANREKVEEAAARQSSE